MLRRGDDRAVSAVVGAVLLLGILVMALSMYQLNVVPSENYETEVNHNERVTGDMIDLQNAIGNAANDGNARGVSMTLGTQYNTRTFSVNPSSPTGTIQTEPAGQNVTIEGNDITDLSLTTNYILYQPNYNEYTGAPTARLEHTLLFNEFRDGNVTVEDSMLFSGNQTIVPIVNGDLSRTEAGTVSVDIETLEGPETESSKDNVTVTLPTKNSGIWEQSLEDRDGVTATYETGYVELELDERYDVKVACIGVGDTSDSSCNLGEFGDEDDDDTSDDVVVEGTPPGPDATALTLDEEEISEGETVRIDATFNNTAVTDRGNTEAERGGVPITKAKWVIEENGEVIESGDLTLEEPEDMSDFDQGLSDMNLLQNGTANVGADLDAGEYDIVVKAMDTRGVWTSDEEKEDATLEVVDEDEPGDVFDDVRVTDLVEDSDDQTQNFEMDIGQDINNDITIDLTSAEGVEYSPGGGNYEVIQGGGEASPVGEPRADEIQYEPEDQGVDAGETVIIEVEGVNTENAAQGDILDIVFTYDETDETAETSFEILLAGAVTTDQEGDTEVTDGEVIGSNVEIDGDVTSEDGTDIESRDGVSVSGEVNAGDGPDGDGGGSVEFGDEADIEEGINAGDGADDYDGGDVVVGDDSIIRSDVETGDGDGGGTVEIGDNSEIDGDIITGDAGDDYDGGDIELGDNVTVTGDVSPGSGGDGGDDGEIICGENTSIDGDGECP